MSNDIDFEQFIKLLDGALASDDKNIRETLRKFLFVAAMVLGDDAEPGPFTKMVETIDALQRRIATLENQNNTTVADNNWYDINSSPTFYPYTAPGTAVGPGGSIGTTGTPPVWTNAVSTTTTSSNTGNITFSGTTSNGTGNITLGGGNASQFTLTPGIGNSTTTTYWTNMDDPETGTEIKGEIMEALDRLATAA